MSLKDKIIKDFAPKLVDKGEQKYTNDDIEFMSSLSAAALQKGSKSSRVMLWITFICFVFFLAWAGVAEVDEIVKGEGKIIPSSQIQSIQSLDGGIISEILVKEGQVVKKDQPLLKIGDISFASEYQESYLKSLELRAKSVRLKAESEGSEFEPDESVKQDAPKILERERSLYLSNKEQLANSLETLKQQLEQKKIELEDAKSKFAQLSDSNSLIQKEISITKPLVAKGVVSEVEYLKLQRQANELSTQLQSTKLSMPKLQSAISEMDSKINNATYEFRNKAKQELNDDMAELSRVSETVTALKDKVVRTLVKSPVNGTVNRLLISTIGGVVQPGKDLIEIVPLEDALLAEAKIRPADIAFLYPGQNATVKLTAYDFSIYGGLKGNVVHISADTITNEKGESYYLVRIKTDKSYLGSEDKPLEIMVGMTVQVDILTGKKTILDYLLKPILKAKQNALTEK